MTREEAKEIFLNRGFIDGVYDGNKWREACIVISKWLEQEPTTKNDLEVDNSEKIQSAFDDGFIYGDLRAEKNFNSVLEDIRTEFEKLKEEPCSCHHYKRGINYCIDVIDKYISGKEETK